MSAPDTVLPQLTWVGVSQVNVAAHPGQNATVRATLQDGAQRSFTGTLSFDPSLGAVDGGLDVGAEAASTWYYLYLVPSVADPAVLAVRGSVTDPRTGPTGYANWVYVGAVWNDATAPVGDLLAFYHWGDRFDYMAVRTVATDVAPTVGSLVATSLANFVPISASHALYYFDLWNNGVWGTVHFYVDGYTASPYSDYVSGTWTTGWNVTYCPNYVPTPTIPKSITHKLTNDGGGCTFSNMDRQVAGWRDGYLRESAQ